MLVRLASQTSPVTAAQATSFHNIGALLNNLRATKLDPMQEDLIRQLEKAIATIGEEAKVEDLEEGDEGEEPVQTPLAGTDTRR
jgi:hypothetical protein